MRSTAGRSRNNVRGQTSVEYILLLMVAVGFCVALSKMLTPAYQALQARLGASMQNLIGGSNLYSFPLGK